VSQFVAEVGDGIGLVALPLYVYARTGSELLTSLTLAAELGLGIVFGVFGGMAADVFDRRKVLLSSYVVRCLLFVGAFAFDPLWAAMTLGITGRALGQGDNPSFDAMMPGQAENDLQQVLAVRRFIQSVSIMIGPAIGAFAVSLIGAREALLFNAVAFALSWFLLRPLHGIDVDVEVRRAERSALSFGDASRDLIGGATVILRVPGLRRLVAYWAVGMGLVAVAMAAVLFWYTRDLGVGEAWYGLAVSGYGTGAALGLLMAGGRNFSTSLPRIIVLMTPVYAATAALGTITDWPILFPIGWLLWGIALGPEMVRGELFFVERISEPLLGRAFAGLGIATTAGMAIGFAAAGPLLERFSARQVTLGVAVGLLMLGTVWIGPALRGSGWTDTAAMPTTHR